MLATATYLTREGNLYTIGPNADLEGARIIARLSSPQDNGPVEVWEKLNFEGANLKNARIEGITFQNCNFENANLEGARITNTIFADNPD